MSFLCIHLNSCNKIQFVLICPSLRSNINKQRPDKRPSSWLQEVFGILCDGEMGDGRRGRLYRDRPAHGQIVSVTSYEPVIISHFKKHCYSNSMSSVLKIFFRRGPFYSRMSAPLCCVYFTTNNCKLKIIRLLKL